ncbi:MAG: hypothetical protein HYR51_06625 [Candidatus Rokubacteria bacterium]|nr:hypothetical protein [Candidatus Rokubacteria bacterium]
MTVFGTAATLRRMRKIRRLVFVVAPGQRQLYESLTRTFAGDDSVQVVLDRRNGERRQRGERPPADRRRADRRRRRDVEEKLAARGYAVVGVVAVKQPAR